MDPDRLQEALNAIPRGRWMSYGDVVRAAGGHVAQARALNHRLCRDRLPNTHRVLCADGRVGETALGDPSAVRRALEAEGVEFVDGRADPRRRLAPAAAAVAEGR